MLKVLIGYFLIVLPLNIFSINIKTTCDLLKFPRECYCQQTPYTQINETRLRCRQLTEITPNYHWSKTSYDRLIFETSNDNLTIHNFVFANIIVRTIRFHIQNLFFQDQIFNNANIGQLSISNPDTYGRINFQLNSRIFSDTIIKNLYFKSIDFQNIISEIIFSNANIYLFLIQSSKFYGFNNKKLSLTKIKSEYESSSFESEQTIIMNITSINYPIYIKIYTIISSINTTNLTKNYFPNNLDYNQLEEIELSFNEIDSLDDNVFYHLKEFKGRLILKNNQIKYLNIYSLDNLFLLKNLSLTKNFIENISSRNFQDLKKLYELDLSFNQIKELDNNTFKYLENLHILYLNNNPLEFIHPEAFSNLTKLKKIYFQGIHLINQLDFQWIWNLANLYVIDLLKNDFELSDVAFCILSRYNQTLSHLSREYSCSCNIHYFNLNQNLIENNSIILSKYKMNYLRLTPICNEENIDSIYEKNINENDLILQDLENTCDYKLMFLDCDAMTTTTIQTTTLSEIETIFTTTTSAISIKPTREQINTPSTRKNSLNNMKKLFTVLGTLIAITIGAIILVFFWYRFKAMLKRRKKKKTFVEQQRNFNSPIIHNHYLTVPGYTSPDILGNIQGTYISLSKSQSEALIGRSTSSLYQNMEKIDSDPIDQDSTEKKPTEMQAVTQC